MSQSTKGLIDKPTFCGALLLLLITTVPLILFPDLGSLWIMSAKDFLTNRFGILYLLLGIGSILFMAYIAFSDIGRIKLGGKEETPEFTTIPWVAMLLCSGIGASILYWSFVEWIYYYQEPPFLVEANTTEAARWGVTYGIFHWGPLAWSIYLIPALPIAYYYYVRKRNVLKFSQALAPVLGQRRANGAIGKLIDISLVLGMLGGVATRLGIAAPLITQGFHELLGLPIGLKTQIAVLILCALLFGYSAFVGLRRGISAFSNFTMWLALSLLVFVFLAGPTLFIIDNGMEILGRMLHSFLQMATWTDSFSHFEQSPGYRFPQQWTVFYWAWWLVFAPSIGLFIARISRGRTIREMIVGSIIYGTLGCFLFYMVLGNYGVYLHFSGELDLVETLNDQGANATIFAILKTLPASQLVVLVYTLAALLFTAITFDYISYILAAVVQKEVDVEPLRWNRIFWAFALAVLPVALMILGGFEALLAASIITGAPLLLVALLLCFSIVKIARHDLRSHSTLMEKEIVLEGLPVKDPWDEKKENRNESK
ncbi:BCCT family transporter [Microbulbifer sp. THAF38]|uniref:BCCT family transporter n=1 Tax=Microbulbifer sp. THAF38 TaxID=2587856 RepID=UPI001267BA32|nr:BCCT family transporter [Microbulbifer sp. THAF38]QFT54908.1 Glycine betaine transporter BetL [Microbulbifer sp. THAF38]